MSIRSYVFHKVFGVGAEGSSKKKERKVKNLLELIEAKKKLSKRGVSVVSEHIRRKSKPHGVAKILKVELPKQRCGSRNPVKRELTPYAFHSPDSCFMKPTHEDEMEHEDFPSNKGTCNSEDTILEKLGRLSLEEKDTMILEELGTAADKFCNHQRREVRIWNSGVEEKYVRVSGESRTLDKAIAIRFHKNVYENVMSKL
uniref:Ovule protein n=1 Tax=Angiostrongylus cantonensis TaxID=6313 RepID=A0A0K0D629_ANGCA